MKIILFILLLNGVIQSLSTQLMCRKELFKTTFHDGSIAVNVLLLWFPASTGSVTTLKVCSSETGLPLKRHCRYDRSTNSSKWEDINLQLTLIKCSSIPNVCLEEPFEHNYTIKNNRTEPFINKWKTTQMTQRGDLQEPCLQKTGLTLTRLCDYNPVTRSAQWELLSPDMRNVSCLKDIHEQIITYDLNTLYHKVEEDKLVDEVKSGQVVQQMTELLTKSRTMRIPADIKISSEILKIITKEDKNPELVTGVLGITDIIMTSDTYTVVKSEEVNASTSFLKTVDNYLQNMAKVLVPTSRCQSITDGIVNKILQRTSVFYINPTCSNISGIAIYNTNTQQHHRHHQHIHFDQHTGNYYRFLYLNQTLDQILKDPELRLATYFPLSLWNKLKDETDTIDDETVLTFVIFENDLLFVNRTRMSEKPKRNILEISIPNYTGELPEDVPFLFSYRSVEQKPNCGYWNYSTWITTGIKTEYKNASSNSLVICHSTHLTHFAALFGVSFSSLLPIGDRVMLNISHDLILDYISILGCGMSLLGLCCIWLTAVCFPSFRVEPSNKVLLNMCFVLSLLMVFFLLLNLPQLWQSYINMNNVLHCQIIGAFLHYIIMVLFFWMLIIALMQYQRYVRVVGYNRPSNYIFKFAFLAWGVPIIPVSLVAYLEPDTYIPSAKAKTPGHEGICYPSGDSLKYGVILPMALIMLANLAIFIYIFCSLHRSLNKFRSQRQRSNIITQIRLSVLLFFLLGISWIFGILSQLDATPLFSYLFCLTSTLQGFVLFLYSIILDKATRMLWAVMCCAKSYNTMENSSQLKSSRSWK